MARLSLVAQLDVTALSSSHAPLRARRTSFSDIRLRSGLMRRSTVLSLPFTLGFLLLEKGVRYLFFTHRGGQGKQSDSLQSLLDCEIILQVGPVRGCVKRFHLFLASVDS